MSVIDASKNRRSQARMDAWHELGRPAVGSTIAREAMERGKLTGWNLRKVPLTANIEGTGEMLTIPDRFAVVRDDPAGGQSDVLSIVGNRYEILQNEDLLGLLDTLREESGAVYETAGTVKDGKWVFVTMKLPGMMKVGGVDPVDHYIAVLNTHDGSFPTTVMVTPIRITGQSTLNLAFRNATNTLKVRHTRDVQKALKAEAHTAIDFTFDYLDGFKDEADKLINTAMSQVQFEKILVKEFGAKKGASPSVQTRAAEKMDDIVELFVHSETQANIRDTAWAGLNALTEYADHHLDVRPGEDGDAVEARSRKAIFDPSFKNRARQLILSSI